MGKFWKKLGECVREIENFIMVWLILIFGLLLVADVIIRKSGHSSMPWIAELSRYMLVATTMIGSALYVKVDGHIKMDLLYNLAGERLQTVLKLFAALVGLSFWFFFSWFSLQWMLQLRHLNKSIECMKIPLWPFWIPFVVSSFLSGVRYVERFVLGIKKLLCGKREKEG